MTKLILRSPWEVTDVDDVTSLVIVAAGMDSAVGVKAWLMLPPCPEAIDCAATDQRLLFGVETVKPDGVAAAVEGFWDQKHNFFWP